MSKHKNLVPVAAYTYISLNEGTVAHTQELDGDLLLDRAEDGTILGIELLTPGLMCGCYNGEEES